MINSARPINSVMRCPVVSVPRPHARVVRAQNATDSVSSAVAWDHVLAVIIDSNQHLNSASLTTIDTASGLATKKLTVLLIDDEPIDPSAIQSLQKSLQNRGIDEVNVIEESIEASSTSKGSVAIGEACDSLQADLVVISSSTVHEKKHVDANLLAEFVPSPILLIP